MDEHLFLKIHHSGELVDFEKSVYVGGKYDDLNLNEDVNFVPFPFRFYNCYRENEF